MSSREVRETISSINRLKLADADYSYLVRRIRQLIVGVPFTGKILNPGTRLYRARRSSKKILHVTELGHPPASSVVSYQRCNPPGKPMFYCASHQATACYEIDAKVGDIEYVSCWAVKREFFTQVIPPDQGEYVVDRRMETIATFFETKFSQPVHEVFSSQYKITSAITECVTVGALLESPEGSVVTKREAHKYGIGCILYPSVSSPRYAECLALHPGVVEQCTGLEYVEEFVITDVLNGAISIERKDVSSQFVAGCIHWTGKPLHWTPKRENYKIVATVEADGWVVRYEDGTVINPG